MPGVRLILYEPSIFNDKFTGTFAILLIYVYHIYDIHQSSKSIESLAKQSRIPI